jgi:transposase-like protein
MEPQTHRRYSSAFIRNVVDEIERGQLSISQARRLYDIGGTTTIQKWLKRFGKHHLLTRIVRVEMKDEVSRLKSQEKKIQELQAALSDAHLKILVLESTVTVLEKEQSGKKKKDVAIPSSRKR